MITIYKGNPMETILTTIFSAAIIYGLVAIIATIINYNRKPKHPLQEKTTWSKGEHPIQMANFVLSITMTIGFITLIIAASGLAEILTIITGGLAILMLFPLLLSTPFLIGFNIPLIWNKRIVDIEKQALKNKNKLVIAQKIFLWLTWLLGYTLIIISTIDTIITSNGTDYWPL